MHVGLNLIFLVPGETGGMEVAARELIPALLQAAPKEIRFTAFVNHEAAAAQDGPWGELLPAVTVPVNARRREQWVFGEQALLPRMAAKEGVELLHSLASTAPVWGRFKRVVTVHDLIYARYPEAHAGLRSLGMRMLVPLAVRRSDRVIVDSQATRRDLVELLHAPPGRVDVVPLGLGSAQRDTAPDAGTHGEEAGREGREAQAERSLPQVDEAEVRSRFDLGERRVLLSLSAKRPHKNLAVLIEALGLIPAERRPLLVLPGYATPHERELRDRAGALGLEQDVRFLGWLSPEETEGLWAVAKAFVFPSLYEGFGLPVLEAMARGVPVACSDVSSLPEVAGEAALLFDPHDRNAIAAAIERLLGDPAEAQRLRALGYERAQRFSWRRTAEGTLASYGRAMGP